MRIPIALVLIAICLSARTGYCEELNVYIYSIGNTTENVLLKLLYPGGDWIQLAVAGDVYKQSGTAHKIYKPAEGYEKWKSDLFSNMAKTVLNIPENASELSKKDIENFTANYRFIIYLQEQIKSGYSGMIKRPELSLTIYSVNKMLVSTPDDESMGHLGFFGYGLKNPGAADLIKKNGTSALILPMPFKNPFAMAMNSYALKINKPANWRLYLHIIIPVLFFAFVVAFIMYMRAWMRKYKKDAQFLQKSLADIEQRSKIDSKTLIEKHNNDIVQRDKQWLEITLSVLSSVRKLISDQAIEADADLPVHKIRKLMKSIAKKANGKWLEAANSELSKIMQANFILPEPGMTVPVSMEEFKNTNWQNQFIPTLEKLINALESTKIPDAESKQAIEKIGTNVLPAIVEAVDREKNKNLDASVEADLQELMKLTGAQEMDVRPGQVYNPEIHELVINNSRSLTTDREQRITKVITRGLLLPGGRIVKAKVSIQR